ncbi:hypothetical protein [Clostridium sp. YIM B02569]|uniref:hypothetical protein n=1 Tax=Clostridium sp. YIM B02569 TaxID=2911967 RepID=UPI001EE9F43A|nr:hypothetical protein [Clostridium sp. YIM B02569]
MGWKIGDKPTVDPKDTDLALIEQDGNTRNTTWAKLKAFFLGTATLTTTDQTIKGAINEVKASTDANTTSLSENTQNISNLGTTKAPLASPNFTGTPQINSKSIPTSETGTITLLNAWALYAGTLDVTKIGNRAFLALSVSSGDVTNGVIVGTLPTGFTPSATQQLIVPTLNSSNSVVNVKLAITSGGNIVLYKLNTGDTIGNSIVNLYINFKA